MLAAAAGLRRGFSLVGFSLTATLAANGKGWRGRKQRKGRKKGKDVFHKPLFIRKA